MSKHNFKISIGILFILLVFVHYSGVARDRIALELTEFNKEMVPTDTTEYTGKYGEGLRRIYVGNDKLMYFREGAPMAMEMLLVQGDVSEFYKFDFPQGARTPPGGIPKIRFERDENKKIKGFTFVFDDEREEFVAKDN